MYHKLPFSGGQFGPQAYTSQGINASQPAQPTFSCGQFNPQAYAFQGCINSSQPTAPSFNPSYTGNNQNNSLESNHPPEPIVGTLGFRGLMSQSTGSQGSVQAEYPYEDARLSYTWTSSDDEAETTPKPILAPQPIRCIRIPEIVSSLEASVLAHPSFRTARTKKTRSSLQKDKKKVVMRRIQCPDCNKVIENWHLSRHRASGKCTKYPRKEVTCPECHMSFSRSDSLARHRRNSDKCRKNQVKQGLVKQPLSASTAAPQTQASPSKASASSNAAQKPVPSSSSSSSASTSAPSSSAFSASSSSGPVTPLDLSPQQPITMMSKSSPILPMELSNKSTVMVEAAHGSALHPHQLAAHPGTYTAYPTANQAGTYASNYEARSTVVTTSGSGSGFNSGYSSGSGSGPVSGSFFDFGYGTNDKINGPVGDLGSGNTALGLDFGLGLGLGLGLNEHQPSSNPFDSGF